MTVFEAFFFPQLSSAQLSLRESLNLEHNLAQPPSVGAQPLSVADHMSGVCTQGYELLW